MNTKNTFYVTTPIYYGTAKPHLGSLYSTVLADVIARYAQLQGNDVFFLTGTDEHGQKIAQAAEKAGKSPKAFVDSFIDDYKKIWAEYELKYTSFIRTTDPVHIKAVQEWIVQLQKTGDIYKGFYQGWYCTPCETYVTEKEVTTTAPSCPSCGRSTALVEEETYFFRLSAYQEKLLQFYQNNPHFIVPKERTLEVINFVKAGLKDLSISRTTVSWGIPFPGDPKHVVYVWADALNNYITAVGYGQPAKEKEFSRWWPADVHVMGKDIVRFHAVYWPAFLMAAGLALPKQLLVHGWILVDKEKMSKSRGNVVDPQELYQQYGADPVRYYLARQLAINQDGEFSIEDLEQKITSDLANDLGNLVNRLLLLAGKQQALQLQKPTAWSPAAEELQRACTHMLQEMQQELRGYNFHLALAHVWKYIGLTNAYFHAQEPWKVAAKDRAAFEEILSATAHSLRVIAYVLWPVMPAKMEQLLHALGLSKKKHDNFAQLTLDQWTHTFTLTSIPPLFVKPEPKVSDMNETTPAAQESYITIDDFVKVKLVVGTIVSTSTVEASDKLLKLDVDFGALGKRQILSGIRKSYSPEDIVNKQAIFVINLPPRKMLGLESQGMMLLAQDAAGKLSMSTVATPVPNGTLLK